MSNGFEYEINVTGNGLDMAKKLHRAFGDLENIKILQQASRDLLQTSREFKRAQDEAKRLGDEMKKTGDSKITAQYKIAQKEVSALSAKLSEQKETYRSLTKTLSESGVNVKKLSSEYARLSKEADEFAKREQAAARLGIVELDKLSAKLKELKTDYDLLNKSGKASSQQMAIARKTIADTSERIKQIGGETNIWARSVDGLQKSWMGLAGTLGSIYVALEGIKFYANFDDVMRSVAAVKQATESETKALTEFAKELGQTTKNTATQAAEAEQVLAQAGQSVSEIFATVPAVLDLSAASGLELADSAEKILVSMKQFNLVATDSRLVADIMTKGFTASAASAGDLALTLSYVGPIANDLHYSLQKTTAMIMLLAEAGYKGERAGTALRGGLGALLKPTTEAQAILDKYGIKIYETNGKVREFSGILRDLEKASLSTKEKLELFGLEAGPGMSAMINQGADRLIEFEKELENIQGTSEKIAKDKEAGIGGALRSLTSAMEGSVIQLSEIWTPAAEAIIRSLALLFNAISKLPKEVLIFGSVAVMAGTGLVAWNLGLKSIYATMVLFIPQMLTALAALKAFVAYTIATKGVTGLLTVAIGGLVANVLLLAAPFVAAYIAADRLIGAASDLRDAEMKASNSSAELAKKKFALSQKLKAVAEDTGIVITNMVELNRAIANGTIHFDEASKKWVKGADEQANKTKGMPNITKEALDKMRGEWEAYVSKVNELQEQVVDRERRLSSDLRELGYKSMSAENVWADRKKQADEYALAARTAFDEANKALSAGDQTAADTAFARAIKLADDAQGKYKEFGQAAGEAFDVAALSAEKSADIQEKVTRDAIESIKRKYEQYADKVKSLQDAIAGREMSLAEQLREIAREGMDEPSAWEDRKKEAEEYEKKANDAYAAAKKALSLKDVAGAEKLFSDAIALADSAREAYADLNGEVKKGEQVYKTQAEASKAASDGIKQAGELAIKILKDQESSTGQLAKAASATYSQMAAQYNTEQQQALDSATQGMEKAGRLAIDVLKAQEVAAQDAADALDKKAGGIFSEEALAKTKKGIDDISVGVDKVGDNWDNNWQDMAAESKRVIDGVQDQLNNLKMPDLVAEIKTVEAKAAGGAVGALKMAAGGGVRDATQGFKFQGYGGGDKVHVIAEAGEHMIKKESVRAAGPGTAEAFNAGDFGTVIKNLMRRFGHAIKMQSGGMVNHRFTVPTLPVLKMQNGGAVAGGSSGMIPVSINLVSGEPPISAFFDEQNLDLLQRQEMRRRKYKS